MFRLKSTRSLLVRSNYLRTPSSNNEIREALKYDDYATRLSASQNKLLKNNVVSWISQCRNEWELYDHNSIIRLSKSEKITCDLCNTKLRTTKVHIKNTLTGESLWIGTDCAQAMLNNEEHAQLAYTPEEQRYLEKFFSDNPTIEHFYKKRPSLTSEFILPSDFLAEEKKLITIIRTQISRKIVKGLPSTKINEINSKIADISSKINSFNAQANSLSNLSVSVAEDIKNTQLDANQIINEVSKHRGTILLKTAQKIKAQSFLKTYLESFPSVPSPAITFRVAGLGLIELAIDYSGSTFRICLPSDKIMDKCKFPVTYPTRSNNRALFNFLATPLTNIRVLDQTTTKLLVQLGLECITSQYQQFNLSFQNFRSYVNSLEKNETNKTNVTRKKFEDSILNRYFFRAANNNIYDIKSTDISTIGLLMLVKQSVVIDQTFATFSLTPKSINAVYNELYTEQQIIS